MKPNRRAAALILGIAAIMMTSATLVTPIAAATTRTASATEKCGTFSNGTVEWQRHRISLQGSLTNLCGQGVTVSVWLSWDNQSHHNAKVGISNRGTVEVGNIYQGSRWQWWVGPRNVKVTVCSNFLGWDCGPSDQP